MENIKFNKITELSDYLKVEINCYYSMSKSEEQVKKIIKEIFESEEHRKIALRGNDFASTMKNRMGKKRIDTLKKFLKEIDKSLYGEL